MHQIKSSKAYTKLRKLKDFIRLVEISPFHFVIPIFFTLLASFFEGISALLLIPFVRGIVKMDFSFVKENSGMYTLMNFFPDLFTMQNTSIFVFLLLMIVASVIVKNILAYIALIDMAFQVRKFSNNVRRMIFARYLSFGNLFFDKNNVGTLNNVLINLTDFVAFHALEFQRLFSQLFLLGVYLSIMFFISWKVSLCVITIFPALSYSVKFVVNKIKSSSEAYVTAQAALSKNVYNILSCMPLVKAYTKEEEEKKKFAGMSNEIARIEFSIDKKFELTGPIQEIVLLIAILILIAVIAFLVVKRKSADVSVFLIYFYLLRRASTSFTFLTNLSASFARVDGPIREILKVFDDQDKFFIVEGKRSFEGLTTGIEFKNVNFAYTKEVPILRNISFCIEKGKSVAIVGPSGAGKTTLINLILRFYECPPATLFIDGVDIGEFTLKTLRAHMALVSQDVFLFNDSIRTNICYGLDRPISEEELMEVITRARLYDFIHSLPAGPETNIGDRGIKLSGGEKQRVALARALLKKSEILMLDEATSSLDSQNERLIQEAINEAIKDKTSIIIAHRLSTVRHADKILVVEQGELIEQGPLEELLNKKGAFFRYWEAQKFY